MPKSREDSGDIRGQSVLQVVVFLVLGVLLLTFFVVAFQSAVDTPGELAITDVEPGNATVWENGTIDVAVEIENVGDSRTTETAELWLGHEQERAVLTLEPGERKTLTLPTINASSLAVGTTTYGASTESDETVGNIVVESDRPPVFEVRGLHPPNLTITIDGVDLTARIANTGGTTGTQPVDLRFGEQTIVRQNMTLAPGAMETFDVYNLGPGSLPSGEQEYGIYTRNDSLTRLVDVPETGSLSIEEVSLQPATLSLDDSLDVTATVTNPGELPASGPVELTVGELETTRNVSPLEPQSSTTVTFETIDAETLGVGTYELRLRTDYDVASRTVQIEGQEPGEIAILSLEPENATVTSPILSNVSATIENTGERVLEESIRFTIDGTTRTTMRYVLGPGERETLHVYSAYVGELSPGVYEYEFHARNESASARFEILD